MNTFAEMELIDPVQLALADEQYSQPTAIQSQAMPPALQGRDVLGCAQTGTGKTAAFAVPILHRLGNRPCKLRANRPLALVLAPTRELAIQIEDSFARYGNRLPLRRALVYGGVNQAGQVRALARGVHILVATPGRLLDLIDQGHVQLDDLDVFVLDEVDRMLDMGFLPDLKRIIALLPQQRQSLFFSATLPPKITELARRLLRNPVCVNVTPSSPSVERIEQRVLFVEKAEKQDLLRRVVASENADRVLVFTRTKRGANVVAERLVRSGVKAVAIHGNKSQNARIRALQAFQRRHVDVLVATDVAARGIDIDGISHVINFDLPGDPESYLHRIGRTGRAGAAGIALSFCAAAERAELRAIEKFIGKSLQSHRSDRPSPAVESDAAKPKQALPSPTASWNGEPPRRRKRDQQHRWSGSTTSFSRSRATRKSRRRPSTSRARSSRW